MLTICYHNSNIGVVRADVKHETLDCPRAVWN